MRWLKSEEGLTSLGFINSMQLPCMTSQVTAISASLHFLIKALCFPPASQELLEQHTCAADSNLFGTLNSKLMFKSPFKPSRVPPRPSCSCRWEATWCGMEGSVSLQSLQSKVHFSIDLEFETYFVMEVVGKVFRSPHKCP